jgi:hypothetical protein
LTRQQRMGEQSRLSTWPDVNVLRDGRDWGATIVQQDEI